MPINNNKKADGINKPLELHKEVLQKISHGAIFLLAPAANHVWYKLFFSWLYEAAACCYFWSRFGKVTRSLLSFPLNGRDSLLLI